MKIALALGAGPVPYPPSAPNAMRGGHAVEEQFGSLASALVNACFSGALDRAQSRSQKASTLSFALSKSGPAKPGGHHG